MSRITRPTESDLAQTQSSESSVNSVKQAITFHFDHEISFCSLPTVNDINIEDHALPTLADFIAQQPQYIDLTDIFKYLENGTMKVDDSTA